MLKQQTVQKLKKMNMQPMVDAATSVDDWLLSEEMKPGAVERALRRGGCAHARQEVDHRLRAVPRGGLAEAHGRLPRS